MLFEVPQTTAVRALLSSSSGPTACSGRCSVVPLYRSTWYNPVSHLGAHFAGIYQSQRGETTPAAEMMMVDGADNIPQPF
jgi:hypothetical protein